MEKKIKLSKEAQNDVENASAAVSTEKSTLDKVIWVLSVIFAAFFLFTAYKGAFISTVQRSVNVCGGIIIWCLMDINKKKTPKVNKVIDVVMIAILAVVLGYFLYMGMRILEPSWELTKPLMYLGILFALVVMEAARRTIGLAVPILSFIGVAYCLWGKYIPGYFGNPGFKLKRIVEIVCFTDRGILGSVTGISATIISVFIIFGAMLFATGGGKMFIDLASLVAGRSAGGAAKMASVASGLFGMISGSSAANVATTGTFTIPMMKSMGYSNEFAGASEASASSGGQIMPPIMGAGAFIMADILSLSYKTIALSAIIPSVLFYAGVIWGIDCYSRKNHYMGIPEDKMPKKEDVLQISKLLPVFLPIGTLIALFLMGFTPVFCAGYSIIVSVVLYLVFDLKNWKTRCLNLVQGLADATKDMLGVISLIACSQILICLIQVSGVGVKFTKIIVALGGNSILLAGLCAMVATMILGMGMPTVAAYILAGSVIAPALVQIGVNQLAAHFFVFYYAIFAGLTPPVCGTVFVAAAMADSNWVKTAWIAIQLSIGAFLVPFILIFNPGMLLIGSFFEIAQSTLPSLVGVFALGAGFMGFFTRNLNWPERIVFMVCGCLMVHPATVTDIVGAVIAIALAVVIVIQNKKEKKAA